MCRCFTVWECLRLSLIMCVSLCVWVCVCSSKHSVSVLAYEEGVYFRISNYILFTIDQLEGGFCISLYKGYMEKSSDLTLVIRSENSSFRISLWIK